MTPSSSAVSALPWLVAAWIVTVVVVSLLIYLIAREVLRKTDPQSLPEVLRALTPLLNGVARALGKLPIGSSAGNELPSGQNEGTSADSGEEAS
jgi:hypothetical protein